MSFCNGFSGYSNLSWLPHAMTSLPFTYSLLTLPSLQTILIVRFFCIFLEGEILEKGKYYFYK